MNQFPTLLERAKPEVWNAIFRELEKYPNTTMNVFEDLQKNKFILYMNFETAMWVWDEVMGGKPFDKSEFYSLFTNRK